MRLGDIYKWNNVFPDSESELAILIAKKKGEGFYWAYQFFFPTRGVKYWFRDTELHYAQLITKERKCQ
tara:strand:+ start:24 stop:227 length:204 start_codon:yes stop_codon:yes gene_type:complete